MESKKTKKADLENKRTLFIQIGLIIAMALVLIALEWGTSGIQFSTMDNDITLADDMITIENTFMEQQNKKVLPPPPQPEEIILVDDQFEIEDEPVWNEGGEQEDPFEIMIWEGPKEIPEPDIFTVVEEMPGFMEGDQKAFRKYVNSQLKYPKKAIEYGITGTVIVQFIVDKNGSIKNVQILRSADPLLDNEVKKVISASPKWTPGKQRGKAVNVSFVMPFYFRLN